LLCRCQLLRGRPYLTLLAFLDNAGYLRHYAYGKKPRPRAAGELNARFRLISNTVIICLKQSLPALVLISLAEGQTAQVPGTGLTITVESVRDSTSQGCLGGPIGCPDNVQLQITRGDVRQQVTLSAAHTEVQRNQEVNRTKVFDYNITLVTLKNTQVVLDVAN
jgi:hypothetical protein